MRENVSIPLRGFLFATRFNDSPEARTAFVSIPLRGFLFATQWRCGS